MLTEKEAAGLFSQHQVAAFAGVTDRTVRNWNVSPVDGKGKVAYYEGGKFKKLWEDKAYDRGFEAGKSAAPFVDADGEYIDVELEKARKLKAERIGLEIKNHQSLGELAPIELLTKALGDAVGLVNTRLETVPASIKRVWPEVPGHVLADIELEMVKVRNAIADSRLDWLQPEVPSNDTP